MGVVMGYLQMRQAEDYWTSEYLAYAKDQEAKKKEEELEDEQKKKEEEAKETSISSTINVEVK